MVISTKTKGALIETLSKEVLVCGNLVPRVSHLNAPWNKLAPGGGEMRDPRNEVGFVSKVKWQR